MDDGAPRPNADDRGSPMQVNRWATDGGEGKSVLSRLQIIADYQWGPGAGEALFTDAVDITRTSSGRPRQVLAEDGRLVSFKTDGRFTLGVAGGRRLQAALDPPAYRIAVGVESEPFICDGKNAFAKFVSQADLAVRPGDEVLVVAGEDSGASRGDLLGVGRAELPAEAMLDFETGVAVKVREGVGKSNRSPSP